MPRPSPEITSKTIGNRYVVGGPGWGPNISYGSNTFNEKERWYVSGKTMGYPNVKPLPYNAYSMALMRRKLDPSFGYETHKTTFWGIEYSGYQGASLGIGLSNPGIDQYIPHDSLFSTDAEIRARARLIENIQRIKVNVAQNVAEYRQVSNMFSTNVRRITYAYRAIRRGDVRGLKKQISLNKRHERNLLNRGPLDIRRNAPSIWLEVQYGWRPLLGDIYTGIGDFYKRVEEGYVMLAKGTGRSDRRHNDRWGPGVGSVDLVDTTVENHKCKYLVRYEVDHSALANMDDWGLTNPALLAWELLPYSFVVDWFLPVGDWLSKVGYSLGLHFRDGMRSGLVTKTTVREFKPIASYYPYTFMAQGSDAFSGARWRREILSDFPSPGRPRIDPDGLRGKRIVNALSLLALAFDRR